MCVFHRYDRVGYDAVRNLWVHYNVVWVRHSGSYYWDLLRNPMNGNFETNIWDEPEHI